MRSIARAGGRRLATRLSLCLSAVAAGVIAGTAPALASSVNGASAGATGNDTFGIGQYLGQFIGLLTGPFAQIAAIAVVVFGVFQLMRGGELHEGGKTVGMVCIAVGVIFAIPAIIAKLGSSTGFLLN
jgi:type IV secretory pathway VirB2 component (pilin)